MVNGVLEVRDLTKRYGTNLAVDGLSFKAEPGRVLGFLGPNGAGKTTTLRMLLGLTLPTSGDAVVDLLPYRTAERPDHGRGRGARGPAVPSGPHGPQPPARARHRRGPAEQPRRRGAPARRAGGRRQQAREGVLARHAPAAQPGRRAARRPASAGARRARQRARPAGDPLAARLPPGPGRRRPDRARVEPRAGRDGADGRRGRGDQPRPAGGTGLARRAHVGRRGAGVGAERRSGPAAGCARPPGTA